MPAMGAALGPAHYRPDCLTGLFAMIQLPRVDLGFKAGPVRLGGDAWAGCGEFDLTNRRGAVNHDDTGGVIFRLGPVVLLVWPILETPKSK
jgi:hypothetical protein